MPQGPWIGNAPVALIVAGDDGHHHIADQRKESERIELFATGYRAHISGDERGEVFENLLKQQKAPLLEAEKKRNRRLRKVRSTRALPGKLPNSESHTLQETCDNQPSRGAGNGRSHDEARQAAART